MKGNNAGLAVHGDVCDSDVCMCVDTSVVLCPLKANKEERGKEDGYCISSQAHSPKAHRSDD